MKSHWLINSPVGQSFSGLARIIIKRDLGKILFWKARFNGDTIQFKVKKENLGNFDDLRSLHPGSCVFLQGIKCITQKGEHSIDVRKARVETQCHKIMPDKYHGLQQIRRYENRMIDLMINQSTFDFFLTISNATYRIRNFLYGKGFREFNTGVLQEFFEAGLADPFITTCNANQKKYSLNLTSELKLKQLVISGYERVFEIMQSFRNEGISSVHSPEFTLLEVYQQSADYKDMMSLVEKMIAYTIKEEYPDGKSYISGNNEGYTIDFTPPYCQISFFEACKWLLDLKDCNLQKLVDRFPESFNRKMHRFTWVFKLIEKYISPYFTNPTFLTEIPSGISPFVKTNSEFPDVSERAVLLVDGMNIADIYTDENDFSTIEKEMIRQASFTNREHNRPFLELLEHGMPPTAGVGLGLNRFFLTLRNDLPSNIKETILYPIK
jgi:lysyl-tRNA synthetase, class II